MLYPRVLGTSICTTFGNKLQFFCNEVLKSFGSTTPGIDIQFEDAFDHRTKYCQIKAGPNTINYDDIKTIEDHFAKVTQLAIRNHVNVDIADCVVGVLYGEQEELNSFYKTIGKSHPVYAGPVFWEHLTGDPEFYGDLIKVFVEASDEMGSSSILDQQVKILAADIKNNFLL